MAIGSHKYLLKGRFLEPFRKSPFDDFLNTILMMQRDPALFRRYVVCRLKARFWVGWSSP